MDQLFFELIRIAIGVRKNLSRIPNEREWKSLYKSAKKQSVLGICFVALQNLGADADDGFEKIGMSEALYLKWMGLAASIQEKNGIANLRCRELQDKLSADGMRSVLLKGQGVGLYYGEELRPFRHSGDIDIWIDASREEVIDYVMGKAPTAEFDQKHIHYHCFEGTEVEAHWVPVKRDNPVRNRRLRRYFDSECERQFSHLEDGLCVPTVDFQLVHQLLHVYGHYVYEGVGMRQMMDLYFTQRAAYDSGSFAEYRHKVTELFGRLGLMRFVAAAQWALAEVFCLPEEQMLCSPDDKEGKKLLAEIMLGGNFGIYDTRNRVDNESFLHRFFRRWGRRMRMFRFDPLGTILLPFTRLGLELQMRRTRRRYHV